MSEGKYYRVKQGDSAESLAVQNGLTLEILWNHPSNKELKELRKDPHVLNPGDLIFIPDISLKEESGSTETTHRFVLKGVTSKIRIVIQENGKPRSNERYILQIDGAKLEGTTGSDGAVAQSISPTAKKGKLILSPGEKERVFDLQLGGLDPITEVSGIQGRLRNLGFPIAAISGKMDDSTVTAVKLFQKENKLPETGKADETTRNKLKQVYGC